MNVPCDTHLLRNDYPDAAGLLRIGHMANHSKDLQRRPDFSLASEPQMRIDPIRCRSQVDRQQCRHLIRLVSRIRQFAESPSAAAVVTGLFPQLASGMHGAHELAEVI